MTQETLTHLDLSYFNGSETVFPHFSGLQYTEGVQCLASKGEAYWLIDAIASHQIQTEVNREPIQFWKLQVDPNKTATLICERDTDDIIVTQHIDYTDFPLEEITLYLANKTLMLPSEY